MVIIGAKGFAKEVLEILHQNNQLEGLAFFDDVSMKIPDFLYEKFPVLRNEDQVKQHFQKYGNQFTIGIGKPILRKKMYDKFNKIGGELISTVSCFSKIGSYRVIVGDGCNILSGVKVSNDVTIEIGTIIYYNVVITHDVEIGKFCEISPSVNILGRVKIGDYVQIGAGAVLFPDIKIGKNSVIAAGAIVRNDVPENVMVAGIPAMIKKKLVY